tara:strand:- start:271 stop:501 length:231 start_codon:yes stop_codon:yes gene_type:complete
MVVLVVVLVQEAQVVQQEQQEMQVQEVQVILVLVVMVDQQEMMASLEEGVVVEVVDKVIYQDMVWVIQGWLVLMVM